MSRRPTELAANESLSSPGRSPLKPGTLDGVQMLVRAFRLGDEAALYRVFYSAIHLLAAKDYTQEQIDAWAPSQPDMEKWTVRICGMRPFVVEDSGLIVGYAGLQSDG